MIKKVNPHGTSYFFQLVQWLEECKDNCQCIWLMANQHKRTVQETGKLIRFTHRHVNPEWKLTTEKITKTRGLGALLMDGPLEELLKHIFEDVESELCNW